MDVMRCWCPPRRVGRCEVPETYRESGFGPPQTKLVSTIVTRSHMQRFADGLGGARLRCGLESERVPGAGTTTKQLISTAIFYGAIFVFVFGINRRFVIYCARTRGLNGIRPARSSQPSDAARTRTRRHGCRHERIRRSRGAPAPPPGRVWSRPARSSSRPTPPRRPPAYSYALYTAPPHSHHARLRARGRRGWRDGGSRGIG